MSTPLVFDVIRDTARACPRKLLISGAAMLGLAIILALLAWWLIEGGSSMGAEALVSRRHESGLRRHDPVRDSLRGMLFAGIALAVLAGLFALGGLMSLAFAALGGRFRDADQD